MPQQANKLTALFAMPTINHTRVYPAKQQRWDSATWQRNMGACACWLFWCKSNSNNDVVG
eukprot:13213531-Alexandrium_andersonii.AAC.1